MDTKARKNAAKTALKTFSIDVGVLELMQGIPSSKVPSWSFAVSEFLRNLCKEMEEK